MKKVEVYETIRKAYYVEKQSIRAISRKYGYGRRLIRKALEHAEPPGYQMRTEREAPVLGPYKARIRELLEDSEQLPRKQRYTARKIYELVSKEGYRGSEGGVHVYVCQERKKREKRKSYLPLKYEKGQVGQVDWGEGFVVMKGWRRKVQLFVMRLNYSRVRFVMGFPYQKQEAFFAGHVEGFHFLGGVPKRMVYDNLKTAIFKVLKGRNRIEQEAFTTFRSYYLFEGVYCNVGKGHEKGGVENDVGYIQRNFLSPLPEVNSFQELNAYLRKCCEEDVERSIRGEKQRVSELWQAEQAHLLPLPEKDYPTCRTHVLNVNKYSQVTFETNRYSVPVECPQKQVALQAYPFQIRILAEEKEVANHARCYEREQDVLEPLHYLGLLVQRPAAFEHAIPLQIWRKRWSKEFDVLLETLQTRYPEGKGVREFLNILYLHKKHPAKEVHTAIQMALERKMAHLDGVEFCLREIQHPAPEFPTLDLQNHPKLMNVGTQPIHLAQYDRLLGEER